MNIRISADGTTSDTFRIGLDGPTIHQGETAPLDSLGIDGDIFLRRGSNANWYTKDNGTWYPLQVGGTIANQLQTIMRGIPTDIEPGVTYVGINPNTTTVDSEIILSDDIDITGDSEPQATTDIVLPIGAEGRKLVLKDERSPAGTYPIQITSTSPMDGSLSKTIVVTGGSLDIVFTNGEWRLVG